MDITSDGRRQSQFALCVEAAGSYGLDPPEARDIVEHQIETIRGQWAGVADEVGLTRDERTYLWGRQVLNAYAFEGYEPAG